MNKHKLTLRKLFNCEVKTQQKKYIGQKLEIFTAEEILTLPEPVQRYFGYCRYLGKEKAVNVRFVFDNVHFKMGVDKPWIKIQYEQYNFVPEPARVAYINSKLLGIIPFEGRDSYLDGQGNMIGKLLKKITLFDVTGPEMNISAAVTFLAEILVAPACALQKYIKWEAIDSNHAKASIEYSGVKAEGIFTFNENGEFIKFQTDERYMDKGKGTSEKHGWSAEATDYIERRGIRMPSRIKGIWNLPDGDFQYFDGQLLDIEVCSKDQ